jgi:enediyne biosynthesis protein E4
MVSGVQSISVADVNGDGQKDIITSGNQSYSRIKFGAYSTGKGDIFINKGGFKFERMLPVESGLNIRGDVRNSVVAGDKIIFGVNDSRPLVFSFRNK